MIPLFVALAVCAVLYVLFFLENRRFQTAFTVCEYRKIRSSFRVVQVSDLHNKTFGKHQEALIGAIRDAKPDLIVITGDLFNRHNHAACEHAFAFAKAVVSIAPTYFSEGNHECSLGETGERYVSRIAESGVCVLQDAYVDLPQCRLIGLRQRTEQERIAALLSSDRFNLVLSHRPERLPVYANAGADVVLCGHAHGGQIRVLHRGVYAPQQGLFPKYTEGWYRLGNTRMYVSRGLGNTIAFPRVCNTPELNVIDFCPIKEEASESCM